VATDIGLDILDRTVPMDRITAERNRVDLGKVTKTLFVGLIYAIVFAVVRPLALAWVALGWIRAAVVIGAQDGWAPARRPVVESPGSR
jgi:hypothetical protein